MAWIAAAVELAGKAYNYADSNYGAGAKAKANADSAAKAAGDADAKMAAELAKDPYGSSYRSGIASLAAAQSGRAPIPYGPTSTFGGVNVGPATRINGAQDKADMEQQAKLAGSLWQTAQGKGPSVAGAQMQQNTEATLAANRAAAAGIGRMNAGLAQRIMGQQQSAALGQAAMGSAQLKAQEALAAQQQLGGVLSGMRAQNFGFQKANADYQHATQLAQAGFSQQGQLASMDAVNRANADAARFAFAQQQASDANAQWYYGQQFAANQADRDAAMRAWAAAKGLSLQGQELDWRKFNADRQYSAAQDAARAQMLGYSAASLGEMWGKSGGSGGGGGGKSGMYDYLAGS